MDGSVVERHSELLNAVVVEPRLGGAKLGSSVVVESADSPELLATQYMNLPRLPEIPKVQLVSDTLNADLLSHHVVELASANDFVQPQVGAQYYEDDLLSHDLTEEDKRLAAALVAVQLVQQQKQQSILATELLNGKTMTHLSPLNVDKPGMMVTSYIPTFDDDVAQLENTTGDRMLKLYQPTGQLSEITPLPPLKKVLSNQSLIRTRYDRPPNEDMTTPTTTVQTIDIKTLTVKGPKDLLSDVGNETEELESDYEGEPELKSSKRSLPHKKRIPRKLKTQQSRSIAKTYKCQKCGESFNSQSALLSHRSTHVVPSKRSNVYTCEICGCMCPNQAKFFEHLKTHYEPNGYQTNASTVIQQPQDHQQQQQEHPQPTIIDYNPAPVQQVIQPTFQPLKVDSEQVKSEDQSLKCEICSRTFRRQKAFETHMAVAHPPIEEFSEPEDMMEGIRHVVNIQTDTADDDENDKLETWRYHDELSITGDLCSLNDSKPVPSTAFPTDHQSSSTTTTTTTTTTTSPPVTAEKPKKRTAKATQCPHCTRVFTHRNSLLYHIRSHSGRRPHQCEVCGKSFFAANALRVHMRMHSGDKPYKCEVCSRSFRQWGDLKYHMTSLHSTQKQYQCEFCGKDFARKYSLIVHRRIHTGEKNYVCEFCRKTFRASSYLVNHRRIHTGEKPYSCDVCHKAFRAKSDMKRHRNTHNKERAITQERITEELIIPDTEPPETSAILSEATVPLNLNMRQDSSESLTYARGDPLDRNDPNTLYVWLPTPAETILSDE